MGVYCGSGARIEIGETAGCRAVSPALPPPHHRNRYRFINCRRVNGRQTADADMGFVFGCGLQSGVPLLDVLDLRKKE
ncbi:hypothetical protein WN55_01441 [Dufourea novaeangliae]|uniref:Uncharacterized protein n=1 Tax=Dufourea novaeangliae TaxID=178035 RepID=A0A154PEN8_DUFNO|nr:hypothetical protein WN55_01441 [Dufourea novaeangliae]